MLNNVSRRYDAYPKRTTKPVVTTNDTGEIRVHPSKITTPPIPPNISNMRSVTHEFKKQELKDSIPLPLPQDRRGKRTESAAPTMSPGAASTQLVTSHEAPKSSDSLIQNPRARTSHEFVPASNTPDVFSYTIGVLKGYSNIPKDIRSMLEQLDSSNYLHFSIKDGAEMEVSIGSDDPSKSSPLVLTQDQQNMVSNYFIGNVLIHATQSRQVEAPKPRVPIEEISSTSAIDETANVRAAIASRCLEATAIVARSTARLMERKDTIFDLPQGWAKEGTSPRQAIAADIMALIKQTEELANPSGPSVAKTSLMESSSTLTDAQRAHLKCAEDFGKCLERYCAADSKGSDVMFLTLTRSILGHIDQVIDTKLSVPLDVSNVKDGESWTVYEALQTNKPADLGLRTTTEGKTAIHAILYGGKSDVSQPLVLSKRDPERSTAPAPNPNKTGHSSQLSLTAHDDSDTEELARDINPAIHELDVQPDRDRPRTAPLLLGWQPPIKGILRTSQSAGSLPIPLRVPIDHFPPRQNTRFMLENGSVDGGSSVLNVPTVDERSTDEQPIDRDQFRDVVAIRYVTLANANPVHAAALDPILAAIDDLGNTSTADLDEWVDRTNVQLRNGDTEIQLNADHLREVPDMSLEDVMFSQVAPEPQEADFRVLKGAALTVVRALEGYIVGNVSKDPTATTLISLLTQNAESLQAQGICPDVPTFIKAVGDVPFQRFTDATIEKINGKPQNENSMHDQKLKAQVKALPKRFEEAVQAVMAASATEDALSTENIVKILYPTAKPREIDKPGKRNFSIRDWWARL